MVANREQRGGREKRKPKTEKSKASVVQAPTFGRAQGAGSKGSSRKKGR